MVRKRRILLVTGARADYGLQKTLIKKIEEHPRLDLLLVVTGSHLSPMHGMTIVMMQTKGFYDLDEFIDNLMKMYNHEKEFIIQLASNEK